MATLLDCCPATRVEGLPEYLLNADTKTDEVWGAWQEIYYAYSAEASTRHLGSTGGLLTGLALYLLESRTVDFILHARASTQHPSFGEPHISRTRDDVLQAAGSRYGPTPTLRNLLDVIQIAQNKQQRFAFIGTPCDVSALRNYARHDTRVDQYCRYMLTMVCGGFMSPDGLKKFIEDQGIDYTNIQSLRYRGNGCPGPTTITMRDGNIHEFTYLDFWGEDDSKWQLPLRCKVCPDGIGDSADIAAADTWDGGSPTAEELTNDLGKNAAIVRSQKGVELMDHAIKAGYLTRGTALKPSDMNRFQPHQESKKRTVWARFLGMGDAQRVVPETKNLRLQQLFQKNSDADNAAQREGAKQRANKS